jgi:hypothetical protein
VPQGWGMRSDMTVLIAHVVLVGAVVQLQKNVK